MEIKFDSNTLIKVAVVLITLVFVLQLFSIGGTKWTGVGEDEPTPTPTETGGTQFLGTSDELNATLIDYPDNLIIIAGQNVTSDESLGVDISSLITAGKISYTNSVDPKILNVILTTGTGADEIGWQLATKHPEYKIYSKAEFSLPKNITFTTAAGKVNVSTYARVTATVEPLLKKGDNLTITLMGIIQNGETVGGLQMKITNKTIQENKTLTVKSCGAAYTLTTTYRWEKRNVNITETDEKLKERYGNATSFSYRADSHILVSSNLTNLSILNSLPYVISTYQNIVFINESFIDSQKATTEIIGLLGENMSIDFPSAHGMINITTGQEVDPEEIKKLTGADEVEILRECKLEITSDNGIVLLAGDDYVVAKNLLEIPSMIRSQINVGASFDQTLAFTVEGARIIGVKSKG